MNENLIYHFFTDDDFLRISEAISLNEKTTAGEIRVAIKDDLPLLNKKDIRKLAEEEFFRLGMNYTRDKTGILIYVNLLLRQFYILADSGINEKVDQATWDKIRDEIQNEFKLGHYTEGIIFGINEVGKILSSNFPIKPDDVNELTNKVEF
ncbi:MAG: TPM domain-containing protein [Melioribacteraceae bacterium]|nr:MAG: TPM domain-containing protein [Melioribacteraceae bacterium]